MSSIVSLLFFFIPIFWIVNMVYDLFIYIVICGFFNLIFKFKTYHVI